MMQAQQMQAMQQQGQGDPNAAFMQAEQMKAQTRAQVDMQKAAMEHQRKMLEMAQRDDLERDGMAQDLLIEAAKILGQYGTSVDVERVRAEQEAPRQFMQGMM
jgi:tellurite resistance protein